MSTEPFKKASILTDLTKCIGCRACASACKEINGLPADVRPQKLSANTWTMVEDRSGVFVRRQCLHCLDPTCVSVCPVAALEKTAMGPVIYHEEKCMGCRYCVVACPFEIPKYEWEKALPRVQKCIMCFEKRVSRGEQPACTSVCPTGATLFGDREDLLKKANQRIDEGRGKYVDHIYGLHEAGGTSVLYLSDVPFSELGFKKAQMDMAYPKLTWNILSQLPNVVMLGGTLMMGLWWLIKRRMTIEEMKRQEEAVTEGDDEKRKS